MKPTIDEAVAPFTRHGSRIGALEARQAIVAASLAATADRIRDVAARDRAIEALWSAVGFWRRPKKPTTAEFRSEAVPPRMLRLPAGRSVPWRYRWRAVRAWAALVGEDKLE